MMIEKNRKKKIHQWRNHNVYEISRLTFQWILSKTTNTNNKIVYENICKVIWEKKCKRWISLVLSQLFVARKQWLLCMIDNTRNNHPFVHSFLEIYNDWFFQRNYCNNFFIITISQNIFHNAVQLDAIFVCEQIPEIFSRHILSELILN